MLKYVISITLSSIIFFSNTANASGLSDTNTEALRVIAARKGLLRLDYNESSKKWGYFNNGYLAYFKRLITSKNRHSVIGPLETLVKEVEDTYWHSVSNDHELFHLIRRAYSSLSSLYSFYKIYPDGNVEKQASFLARFGVVLAKYKEIIDEIEGKLPTKHLYKARPFFDEQGVDEKKIGLNYLDMGKKNLSELNTILRKIGNDDTKIDRALEFYPSRHRDTPYRSSFSESITKKPVIFLVHGTFAAGSPEYLSDQNILFQQTKYMAQSIANDQNMPVEVYSFGWNGKNDNEARIDAGVELANFVNTFFPKEEYNDIYIGHSHGGNVIFHFAKTVRYARTPSMIITLATPIRKDFITENIDYLFEFYSESDFIQYAGSYELTTRSTIRTGTHTQSPRKVLREDIEKMGYFSNNDKFDKVKIYSTKVMHNHANPRGRIQSHINMKYLIATLPRIIDSLLRYDPNNQYALNVDLDENEGLTVTEMDRLQFQLLPKVL
ncbi:MAG: hypothetical protein KA436_06575 [Oligoflexales bacterium]|nr:hypothetical protein [Oligoflexales bacterium]